MPVKCLSNNVPTFNAVLRNVMYRFMCRLSGSKNTIIVSLTDVSHTHLASGNIGPEACMRFKINIIADASFASFLHFLHVFLYVLCCFWTFLCLE